MELLSTQPTTPGPAEMFTGQVWFDVIARGEDESRVRVNTVRFAPCSRTAWFMSHLAIWEDDDATWGELVTDEEDAACFDPGSSG